MASTHSLNGGSYGEQRSLHLVGGFIVSETRHRKGQRLPRHAHERASINFVLAGAYAETFRGANQAHIRGSVIIKPAGEAHANDFRDAAARCLLIEITHSHMVALPSMSILHAPSLRTAPMLAPLVLRIVRELKHPDAFTPLAVESHILELLVTAARSEATAVEMKLPRWLRNVVERIHDAPLDISLAELAAETGVHAAHLSRAFRHHFHMSPGEYARELRLERAIELLRTTLQPIGTIALQAGFFDQSHFCRCVKRKTGMSPSELRRSLTC